MLLNKKVIFNIPSQVQLNWHALQYAIYRAGRVEFNHLLRRKKLKPKNYPSCVACIECLNCGNIYYAGSRDKMPIKDNFTKTVRDITKWRLGHEIGEVFAGCEHPVGNCAEYQVFDKYLRGCKHRYPQDPILKQMYVQDQDLFLLSSAYRPRTQEYMARCAYCQPLFGNEV